MATTKLFRQGNSQAVLIPSEFAFPSIEMELEIERADYELRIRPARKRIVNINKVLANFSPDFMASGRGDQSQSKR